MAPPLRPRARWAVACAILLVAVPLLAGADHPQTGSGRVIAFNHVVGNEWWVEVVLSGQDAGQVATVEAQDTSGPWVVLPKRSWGAYAASFHLEPGHQVRFRAGWAGGAQSVSCWFDHPSGVERCTSPPPPPTGLSFDHRVGNEWWVEGVVAGAAPARVQAQDDGGPWTELALRSWGAWAASFRIEPGHNVRFRADVDGAWRESCWFSHPQGNTPTGGATCGAASPAPPPAFATFSDVKGNPYWVEARVQSNRPLAGVEARADDGAWRPLTLRSWGAWASSFAIHDGAYVELRATAQDGTQGLSGDYVWPSARPVRDWPQSNSFVAYDLHIVGNAPDGSYSIVTDARLRLQYDGEVWMGLCTGSRNETVGGESTIDVFDEVVSGVPAFGPSDAQAGAFIDLALFEDASYGSCRLEDDLAMVESYGAQTARLRDASGRGLRLAGWRAVEPPENSPFEDEAYAWEGRHGLMLAWARAARGGGFDGGLVESDAPIW